MWHKEVRDNWGKIDEEFLVNTLVQSLGVFTAKAAIISLRTCKNAENIELVEDIGMDLTLQYHCGINLVWGYAYESFYQIHRWTSK